LMQMNPGVPSLSQGQTIFLPGNSGSGANAAPVTQGPRPGGFGLLPALPPRPPTPGVFNPSASTQALISSIGDGFDPSPVNMSGSGSFQYGAPVSPSIFNLPPVSMRGGNSFQSGGAVNSPYASQPAIGAPGTNQAGYARNTDPANTDPRNTAAYRQAAAEGTSFVHQQRWDPERRRFVTIGQLINEGRLDVRDSQARLRRSRAGRADLSAQTVATLPEAQQQGNAVNNNVSWRVG
jgi:hypothetical protein